MRHKFHVVLAMCAYLLIIKILLCRATLLYS